MISDRSYHQKSDHKRGDLGNRSALFFGFMQLISIQLRANRSSGGNGGTEHTHGDSLFFIQIGAFLRQDLLFEQEICAGEMIIDTADE